MCDRRPSDRFEILPLTHCVPEATDCHKTLPLLQRPNWEVPLQTTSPSFEQVPEPDPEPAVPVPDGGIGPEAPVEAGPETPAPDEKLNVGNVEVDAETGVEEAGGSEAAADELDARVVIPEGEAAPEPAEADVAWDSLEEGEPDCLLPSAGAEEAAPLSETPFVIALAAAAQPGPVGGWSFAVAAFFTNCPGSGTSTSAESADLQASGPVVGRLIKYMFGKAS